MGAYDLLLDWCYANERPLPLSMTDVFRIGRAVTKAERANVSRVKLLFFTHAVGDGFSQKRVVEEIERANAQSETNKRIADERESRKRERIDHEALNEACTNRSTKTAPARLQTPDSTKEQELSNPDGLEVIAAANDVHVDHVNGVAKPDRTPVQEIIAMYHRTLTTCRRCEKVTTARAGYIRQRWRDDLKSLDAWQNFFDYVAQSAFLMGRAKGREGQPPFQADIEFLTKPASFAKIAEGKYHL